MSYSGSERGKPITPVYCRHHSCRCTRARELAFMSDATNRIDLLAHALDIFTLDLEVRCTHVPRDPNIPFHPNYIPEETP